MHGPPRTRHRDIKLCLVRLAERPDRHAGNDLVDSLRLAGVTGDSYSLVEMQKGSRANNLAFIEYDLAIINADHGPELVIEELLPAVFDVFRESDPVADCHRKTLNINPSDWPSFRDPAKHGKKESEIKERCFRFLFPFAIFRGHHD